MSRLDEIEARLADATPGPWERPLNTRFKATVTALLPDDEESHWLDRKTPDGSPERIVVVQCPTWSNGRHNRKRSGRDLDLIANAPADLAALVSFARRVQAVLDDHVSTNEQVFDELDRAMRSLNGGAS